MRIGLISDTHDNEALAEVAGGLFHDERVDRVFHLGDVTQPETLDPLHGFPLIVVQGNNDEEPWPVSWQQELEGQRVGATHGHHKALLARLIGECDVVLHGHTHKRRAERVGRALVINPGALHRTTTCTIATLDLPEKRVRFYEVAPSGARLLV